MGGRATRRARDNEDTDKSYNYKALPPSNESLDIASLMLDESSSSSSSSTSSSSNPNTKRKLKRELEKHMIRMPSRLHRIGHSSEHHPISPTIILEQLIKETLPNLCENTENDLYSQAEKRFERIEEDSKEEEISSISDNTDDSGDISDKEEDVPMKISEGDDDSIHDESLKISSELTLDYNKFCDFIRPQLESLLNGYPLSKVPFTLEDYKKLLKEYNVNNFDSIVQRGLSINYQPQVVIIQNENTLESPQELSEEAQSDIQKYLDSRSQSVYYIDGKCVVEQ